MKQYQPRTAGRQDGIYMKQLLKIQYRGPKSTTQKVWAHSERWRNVKYCTTHTQQSSHQS